MAPPTPRVTSPRIFGSSNWKEVFSFYWDHQAKRTQAWSWSGPIHHHHGERTCSRVQLTQTEQPDDGVLS